MSIGDISSRLMWLMLIVRRSLRQHALSSLVTIASVSLASGLVMAVFSVNTQTYEAFTVGSTGFDAVLGARGSETQIVLNTVFHLETSPGNLEWAYYQNIKKDSRVELAIPYAVGDSYRGFRVVGSINELFNKHEYREGQRFGVQPGGRFFDPVRREAVIGSYVAQKTGLRVGSTFQPSHGLIAEGKQHQEQYVVVGVLRPTNTPSDRVIWIPIEGVYRMSGHVLRGIGQEYFPQPGEPIPDWHKEVSAVMLKLTSPQAGFALDQTINKQGKSATLAWPIGRVMADLFEKIGWVNRVMTLVAYLVVIVAIGSILASIYNTMNERGHEFAILRALGASSRTVFSAIILESTTIALLGSLCGYAVYMAILGMAGVIVRAQTGVVFDLLRFHPILLLTPISMIVIGALAGIVPAFKAYATDVATNLTPIA